MIAIIDYGMGNLRSVQKALEHCGAQAVITEDKEKIMMAQKIVLPGVGAMKPAMDKLKKLKLIDPIKQAILSGKPFLGICLGFQLLFEESNEGGKVKGFGILDGKVTRFQSVKVPHMGWNQIEIKNRGCPLTEGIENQSNVYFCHSYFAEPKDKTIVLATTLYGKEFASAVCKGNLFGVQFHPEKSQSVGLNILTNFVNL